MIAATILEKFRSNLKIQKNISLPDLKRGQVLVKIKYTGICASQLFEIAGSRDNKKFFHTCLVMKQLEL